MRRLLGALGALLALGAPLTSALPASAAGDGAPGLRMVTSRPPGYFDYTLQAGGVQTDMVQLVNPNDSATQFLVYTVDAVTSDVSGIVYPDRARRTTGTGTWVALASPQAVTLKTHETRTIDFKVTVPGGTAAGDYVAGIVAENPTPSGSASGHFAVNVVQRAAIAVVIHIAGVRAPGLQFGAPQLEVENGVRQVIYVPITSSGNVLMKPTLVTHLETCAGDFVLKLDRQLDSFVPHSTIRYPFYLDNLVLKAGCYRLVLEGSVGGTTLASTRNEFQVSPVQAAVTPRPSPGAVRPPAAVVASGPSALLLVGLGAAVPTLLLAGAGLFLVLRRRRRRSTRERV
ncbi:MAG: WxL protein peptidoglycan domain-containing protein [Candidatus Dormibacteria bacterium]